MSNDLQIENFRKRFEDLMVVIESANDKLLQGVLVELGDMEKKVAQLCKDIEKAPQDVAKETNPMMAKMISKLDELAQSLVDFRLPGEKH